MLDQIFQCYSLFVNAYAHHRHQNNKQSGKFLYCLEVKKKLLLIFLITIINLKA